LRRSSIDLSGCTAAVTGASGGIGGAIALGIAEAGADVIGLSRSPGSVEPLGEEIAARGREFLALALDLTDLSSLEGAVESAWRWQDGIDVLVNAAGVIVRREVPEIRAEDWDRTFAVNVRGPFFLSQAVGTRMRARGSGSIVNVTSVAAEVATGAPTSYASSKAALVQITRLLAVRLAPEVRVNAVGPAYVRTPLNSEWLADPENERLVVDRTPAGRLAEPDDVVGAVIFLASAAAAYVTGQHLLVDGGWTAR
jgi:NAD(P)-dependent dehydrogenase (short-subunit alcohol dehydrogenase family)